MVCAECGVYEGDPVCGACRALSRIAGILRSGHLSGDQQKVTEELRGVAGELSDLIDQRVPKGSGVSSSTTKEGIRGLTSGPSQEPAPKAGSETKKKESSEYSYLEGEEEEESVTDKVKGEVDEEEEGGGRYKDEGERSKELAAPNTTEGLSVRGGPVVGVSDRQVDPHYLSKALQLKSAPKPYSGKESRKRSREPEGEGRRHTSKSGPGAGESAPDSWRGDWVDNHDEEDSQGRAPLPRRNVKRARNRDRGTKGLKKRERTRKFRQDKIDQRRREKREREWRQRQKQRQPPKDARGRGRWRS